MKKVYLIRHLQRIDGDDGTVDETSEWNTRYRTEYESNPYIIQNSSVDTLKTNLLTTNSNDNFDDFFIVTSPFLRCIQTSLLIANKLDMSYDKIKVHYGLSELNDGFTVFPAYTTQSIYDQTLQYLRTKDLQHTFDVINDDYKGGNAQEDSEYFKRVKNAASDIKKIYNKTIICTHAYSAETFGKAQMKYNDVVDITELIGVQDGGKKYKKYYLKK